MRFGLERTFCRVGRETVECTHLWLFGRNVHTWIGKKAF
jgi:hypothetical protein